MRSDGTRGETGLNSSILVAHTYVLTALKTGRVLGVALLCLDARYAGVFAAGGQRLDRRFLKPSQWLAVERELIVGHPPGTLRSDSAIACALAGSGTIAIEALKRGDVKEDSGGMIAALDRRLRESA